MAGVSSRLALSADDAEMCLDNAKGLRKDSKKTSAETSLALLELSMEECSKGIILLFDRMFKLEGFDPSSTDSLSRIADPELRALYMRYAKYLSGAQVRRAFRYHDVKLQQLQFVLDLLDYYLRHGLADAAIRRVLTLPGVPLGTIIRIALVPRKDRSAFVTQSMRNALEKINKLGVTSLDKRKNEALYVGLLADESGCTFPEVDEEFLDEITECCNLLIEFLDGAIMAIRPPQ